MDQFPFPITRADELELYVGTWGVGRCVAGNHTLDLCVFPVMPGQTSAVQFTAADVGMPIYIVGGGPVDVLTPIINGIQGSTFVTTIASINSASSVQLTDAPVTSFYNTGVNNVAVFRRCLMLMDSIDFQSSIAPGTRDTLAFATLHSYEYFTRNQTINNGQPVLLTDDEGNPIFGGLIDVCTVSNQLRPGGVGLTPATNASATQPFSYTCHCASWDSIASRRVVQPERPRSYTNQDAGVLFRTVVVTDLDNEGVFPSVDVGGLPKIDLQVPAGAHVIDILNQIAAAASDATNTFFWYIDANLIAHFTERTVTAAPWDVDDVTGSWTNILLSVSVERSHNQFGDEQYVLLDKLLTIPLVITFLGDGAARSFNLPREAQKEPSITLNGSAQTVGILGVETGKDWYWNQGSTVITQDQGGTTLTPADSLVVTYFSSDQGIAVAFNGVGLTERSLIEGPGTLYQNSTPYSRPVNRTDALGLARALATEYGTIPAQIRPTTLRSGLQAGMLQHIRLAELGVNDDFLIAQVHMTTHENVVVWDYQAIAGSNIGNLVTGWTKFINRGDAGLQILTPVDPVTSASSQNASKITIDHTKVSGGADLTNFPFLFVGEFPFLATIINGGYVQNDNGYDIRFSSDAAGTNLLDFDLEFYGQGGFIIAWVRIPTVSHTADTVIYILYGNPSITTYQGNPHGTWSPNTDVISTPNANFHGVFHLDEASAPYVDKTKYGNDSTGSGGHNVTGYPSQAPNTPFADFSFCQLFSGAEGIVLPNLMLSGQAISTTNSQATVTCWIKSTAGSGSNYKLAWDLRLTTFNECGPSAGLAMPGGAGTMYCGNGNFPVIVSSGALNDGAWHHLAVTFDIIANESKFYVDGLLIGTDAAPESTFPIFETSNPRYIGASQTAAFHAWDPFDGNISETHFAETILTAGWIATEYANQKDPATFFTVESAPLVQALGNPQGTVTHSTGALTADEPIFGAGGADVKVGTKTGNTDEVVTASGAATSGEPLFYDVSGNAVAGTKQGNTTKAQVATGSAGGTGDPLVYDANGNAVTGSRQGNTSKLQSASGSAGATGAPLLYDASGNAVAGTTGQLVPAGGTTGQVLEKNSNADGDTKWGTISGAVSVTTKGDLQGYDTAPNRVPVGSNGEVLTADSTQALGVKWSAPAGGITKFATTFTSSTSVTVTHNLGTTDVIVQVYDDSSPSQAMIAEIEITDSNTVTLTFEVAQTGHVVVLG